MGQVGQAGHCISPELARVIWSLNLDFKSHPKKKKKKPMIKLTSSIFKVSSLTITLLMFLYYQGEVIHTVNFQLFYIGRQLL